MVEQEFDAKSKSDQEIMTFMVERYGDFVLYRPPVKAVTIGLWVGPLLMVAAGMWLLWRHLRRATGPESVSSADRDRVKSLVDAEQPPAAADKSDGGSPSSQTG